VKGQRRKVKGQRKRFTAENAESAEERLKAKRGWKVKGQRLKEEKLEAEG